MINEYIQYLTELIPEKDSLKLVLAMALDDHCKIIGDKTALPLIEEWLNSDCANVRRAVSEELKSWDLSSNEIKQVYKLAGKFLDIDER